MLALNSLNFLLNSSIVSFSFLLMEWSAFNKKRGSFFSPNISMNPFLKESQELYESSAMLMYQSHASSSSDKEKSFMYTSSCWLAASRHQLRRHFKNLLRWLDAEMTLFPWKVRRFYIDLSGMAWGWPAILVKLRGRKKASIGLRELVAGLMGVSIVNKNWMSEIDSDARFSRILWDSSLCNLFHKILSGSEKCLNTLCDFLHVENLEVLLNCRFARWTE